MPLVAAMPVVLIRSPMMRTAPRPTLEMRYGAFDRLAGFLRIGRARITDASIEYFAKMPKLKVLGLPKNLLSLEAYERLRKLRPSIEFN